MAKILKNLTSPAVDIEIYETGVTVPASGQIIIDPINYLYWATAEAIIELTPHLNAGDIVVNDGLNDLSPIGGINYLRYSEKALNQRFVGNTVRSNGFPNNISTQEAIEFAKTTVSGKMQDFEFTTVGNTADKWVNISHPSDSSDTTPFVALWAGSVVGMSFINKNDSASTDLEFYVNGTLVYTWGISAKRWAYNTDESGFFTVAQGDRISIFAKRITGTSITHPSGVSGEIMAIVSSIGTNTGGAENGV